MSDFASGYLAGFVCASLLIGGVFYSEYRSLRALRRAWDEWLKGNGVEVRS